MYIYIYVYVYVYIYIYGSIFSAQGLPTLNTIGSRAETIKASRFALARVLVSAPSSACAVPRLWRRLFSASSC